MTSARQVIGIVLCLTFLIAGLASPAAAATGSMGASQGKGTRLGLAFADQKAAPASPEEIRQTIRSLEARMEKSGITGAVIEQGQVAGEAIQVFLPQGADVEGAKRLLTYAGLFELKLVARNTSIPYGEKGEAEKEARALEGGLNKYEVVFYRQRPRQGDALLEGWIILEKIPVITGADMSKAKVEVSRYSGNIMYAIDFYLTPDGAARFGDATGKHVGDNLAIVINNEVQSAPTISSQITDHGQITGAFTRQAAEDLALTLGTGPLPRPLRVVSERTVGAGK